MVQKVGDNATYHWAELDGTLLALPIAGKTIKIFKRRHRLEIGFDALENSFLSIDDEAEESTEKPYQTWHIPVDVKVCCG